MKDLEYQGAEVTFLEPDLYGRISLDKVRNALRPHTRLVSLIFANNEIGTLNPISEIGNFLTSQGVLFHTDAVQAYGQVPIDVQKMGIDLLSMTAHKIYGPKGVGALFVRQMPKRVRMSPLILGGGQEKGLRAGTLNTPLIVGFGKAAEIAMQEMKKNSAHAQELRDKLLLELLKIPMAQLNGHPTERLANNLNMTFKGIPNSTLLMQIKELAVSTGSACSTGSSEPSHVLKALGLSDEDCMSSIRISVGRPTTEQDIQYAASQIKNAVFRIKERSF
jgi:cysteine desulfurase